MATASVLSPVLCAELALGSSVERFGEASGTERTPALGRQCKLREGRHRASCSGADPTRPDNMSKQEFSGEKKQEALLTFLPTQHGAPVRADCRQPASAPQRSLPKTLTYFCCVDMYPELPANAFLV